MTKKDYIIVASTIEHELAGWRLQGVEEYKNEIGAIYCLVFEMCERFIEDNPRFDKNKFIKACGLEV